MERATKRAKTGVSEKEVGEIQERVLSSPKNYNEILTLLNALEQRESYNVATALLRIFGKLAKRGAMTNSEFEAQNKVAKWLQGNYGKYKTVVFKIAQGEDEAMVVAATSILMKLVKLESKHFTPVEGEHYFPRALFDKLLLTLLQSPGDPGPGLEHLAEEYMQYDDIRYYFYQQLGVLLHEDMDDAATVSDRLCDVLTSIGEFPGSDDDIDTFYLSSPPKPVRRVSSHKSVFQKGWLAYLRLPQTIDQYKAVLIAMHENVTPHMSNPHLLMDFLTAAYDAGGAVSLLALNALFNLMQRYNLDYPNFFTKLYALFDDTIMHVRYRSRFLRLVDLFLTSTHLPVNVMASFIKRMARLALTAPPPAVIAIVPFIYNQLKRHPKCMQMIHRDVIPDDYQDPFDNTESDPGLTGAINSSLWELETLENHYHPNVSALARIMSQPFRKPQYPLEDFLGHTYQGLVEMDLNKRVDADKAALEFEEVKMFGKDNTALIQGFTL